MVASKTRSAKNAKTSGMMFCSWSDGMHLSLFSSAVRVELSGVLQKSFGFSKALRMMEDSHALSVNVPSVEHWQTNKKKTIDQLWSGSV